MRTLDTYCGFHISDCCKKAVALAKEHSEPVQFEFNGTTIVCQPGDAEGDLRAQFDMKFAALCEDERLKREAWLASPEGKAETARREAAARLREQQRKEAIDQAAATMTLRDEVVWKEGLAKNTDPYGRAVYTYAELWARIMEGRLASGQTVAQCAKQASNDADTEGITGFMYGCAVSVLALCWAHGDELRRWHNLDTQIRDEGERANETGAVLNPAVLTFAANQEEN